MFLDLGFFINFGNSTNLELGNADAECRHHRHSLLPIPPHSYALTIGFDNLSCAL